MQGTRILVFSKAPVPGQVKTRLIPALGEEGAARLQQHLIYRTLTTTEKIQNADTELHCAPDTKHAVFQSCKKQFGVELMQQQGANLGERMLNAASIALTQVQKVVLIGTDCPALDALYLERAIEELKRGTEAVFGPALDGGYVLLGLRRIEPALFSGIEWGTAHVLDQTRARLSELSWHWQELTPLADLDRPEDLLAFPELTQLNVKTIREPLFGSSINRST